MSDLLPDVIEPFAARTRAALQWNPVSETVESKEEHVAELERLDEIAEDATHEFHLQTMHVPTLEYGEDGVLTAPAEYHTGAPDAKHKWHTAIGRPNVNWHLACGALHVWTKLARASALCDEGLLFKGGLIEVLDSIADLIDDGRPLVGKLRAKPATKRVKVEEEKEEEQEEKKVTQD